MENKMENKISKKMDFKKSQISEIQKEINNIKRNIVSGNYDTLDKTDGWTELHWKLDKMTHLVKKLCKYELQYKKLKDCLFNN